MLNIVLVYVQSLGEIGKSQTATKTVTLLLDSKEKEAKDITKGTVHTCERSHLQKCTVKLHGEKVR